MALLSVSIITLNEERNIARCLRSLQDIADEIVVVDSGSTDQTKQICESFGVSFIVQPFLGFIEQKNFAMAATTHPFVLSIDADEELSPELKQSIIIEKNNGFPFPGYIMSRRSWFCDKWIGHGTWYPDRKLRLVKKESSTFVGFNGHDKLELIKGLEARLLKGDLMHYTYYSLDEFILKTNQYSTMSAKALFEAGKKASILNLLWNPFFTFFKSYFLKAGFLDGFNGYIIARHSASQTFLKYAKLIQLQRMQH